MSSPAHVTRMVTGSRVNIPEPESPPDSQDAGAASPEATVSAKSVVKPRTIFSQKDQLVLAKQCISDEVWSATHGKVTARWKAVTDFLQTHEGFAGRTLRQDNVTNTGKGLIKSHREGANAARPAWWFGEAAGAEGEEMETLLDEAVELADKLETDKKNNKKSKDKAAAEKDASDDKAFAFTQVAALGGSNKRLGRVQPPDGEQPQVDEFEGSFRVAAILSPPLHSARASFEGSKYPFLFDLGIHTVTTFRL